MSSWILSHAAMCSLFAAAVPVAAGQTVERLDGQRWLSAKVRRLVDVAGFEASDTRPALSEYGGQRDAPPLAATGFFRTAWADGRWWLVDPGGHRFISIGLCSVNLSRFDGLGRFADEAGWAEATGRLLRAHGFNTLGRWSHVEALREVSPPMAYCTSLSFMGAYKNVRDPGNGARGFPCQTMPVFDAEWASFCDAHARGLAATRADPWLLGHFSDNELPFRPDALANYLRLSATDPGHRAASEFLASRGKQPAGIEQGDADAFLTLVAERYYSTVGAAIRRYDPNHLFLGSRLHGRCICPPVFRGAAATDVVSVNYYHRWSPEPARLAEWVRLSGRPFLVSEWYAMAVDPDDPDVSGAGFRVRTQRDRGLFYQNFVLGLLEQPGCLGWHWFRYGGAHKGIVDGDFLARRPLLELMAELHRNVYPLAAHLLAAKPKTPAANATEEPRAGEQPPLRIIFDTDMDTDCDDAGALAMLHALADRGEVEILATVVSSRYPYSAPCVEAINRHYGRAQLPIGVPKGDGASTSRGSRYARTIAEEYPTRLATNDDAPPATEVYRRVLSAQPDGSVVLVTVGYLTNIRDLLASDPDEHSTSSGRELVRQKVKHWVCMGGRYPEQLDPGVSGNFKPDARAAVAAVRDFPGTIWFSGDGRKIQTGERLRTLASPRHPVRRIYDLYLGSRPTRPSWDQVALLWAVRPAARYWRRCERGTNHIFPNGTNQWRSEPDDPRHRLVQFEVAARKEVTATIEELMAHGLANDED